MYNDYGNGTGYTSNGCSRSLALSVWVTNNANCSFYGGSNVVYVKFTFVGSTTWTSPGLILQNPVIVINN